MTIKTVSGTLRKIEAAKSSGFHTEAYVRYYHLSLAMVRYILKAADADIKLSARTKPLIKQFVKAEKNNHQVKAVINAEYVRDIRNWFEASEAHLKKLKHHLPAHPKTLLNDATRISGVLVEAANKMKQHRAPVSEPTTTAKKIKKGGN